MEQARESTSLSHKEWRRIAKRERRRRIRRKAAQDRDLDEERLRATLESTAEYTNWIAEQLKEKRDREIVEKQEHDAREKLWLEEEVRKFQWNYVERKSARCRKRRLLINDCIFFPFHRFII